MGKVIRADIYDVTSDRNIPWDDLRDSAVFVTGATGLVGSALCRSIAAANTKLDLGIRLIGHGTNRSKGDSLAEETGMEFIRGDIRELPLIDDASCAADYIVHCASITKSAEMAAKPADVAITMADGTRNVLELARVKCSKSILFVSSMEVYGQTGELEIKEDDLGYLSLSDPRSSYPESKRYCEMLCNAYAAQYGINVKTARLAQTFGAGTSRSDTRVFAQFAKSALAYEDIELHTEGRSQGNYCYISDTVRALLTILLKGERSEAYNVANPAARATIREMAEMVAGELCSGRISVRVSVPNDISKRGYAPSAAYALNADKLAALGWSPKYGLDEMYRRMLADWRGV